MCEIGIGPSQLHTSNSPPNSPLFIASGQPIC